MRLGNVLFVAQFTRESAFSCVVTHMRVAGLFTPKRLAANPTRIRFLPRMNHTVFFHLRTAWKKWRKSHIWQSCQNCQKLTREPFIAESARERFHAGVNARVQLQIAIGRESFTARQTHVTFLICQQSVISVTVTQCDRKLTGVYQHVHVDVRLLFEFARANLTFVLTLFVRAFVLVQTAR